MRRALNDVASSSPGARDPPQRRVRLRLPGARQEKAEAEGDEEESARREKGGGKTNGARTATLVHMWWRAHNSAGEDVREARLCADEPKWDGGSVRPGRK